MTHSGKTIVEILENNGLRPSRALGQNFLADANTARRITRLAGVGAGDQVVEIGAGLGSLTLALVETGAVVKAIEIDRFLLPILRGIVEPHGVEVVAGDALELDWSALLGAGDRPWMLVANLPYNVSTPLLLDLLAKVPQITRFLVMVQREVAERLAADPGSKACGIPSAKRAWWATAKILGTVPASVFIPRPNVESALLQLVRRAEPAGPDPDPVFRLIEAGFAQRRKMLRGSLAAFTTADAFTAAGIDPTSRGESLTLSQWQQLAAAVALHPLP